MTLPLIARQIVRACRSGALATLHLEKGAPYVSFCSFATDFQGRPIFLFSDLSDHTKNFKKDARISFLCEQASHLSNPQTGPRVSLDGKIERTEDPLDRALYLTAHAPANMYAGFGDFNFYKMEIENAHYVGGFGKAHWLERAEFLCESAAAIAFQSQQEEIISTITDRVPELAVTCATKFLKQRGKKWKIIRVDPDGIDLKRSATVIRYPFENEMKNISDFWDWLNQMQS